MSVSSENDSPLMAFVRQSNAIEGIVDRPPTKVEVDAHRTLLALERITVDDMERFVADIAPGKPLRRHKGMNVRVGPHLPPPGGPAIVSDLTELLWEIGESPDLSPWLAHLRYETLHPFMDGNGRSGRALWLWMIGGIDELRLPLGFLHAFYYQTLQRARP